MPLFGPPNIDKMKDRRNINGLIKALGYRKEMNIRGMAALALGELGDPHAVEPLIAALKDDWYLRDCATKALGRIGDARAAEPLILVLMDVKWLTRESAAEALGRIGDARAIGPLIASLDDDCGRVRRAAARALVVMIQHHQADQLLVQQILAVRAKITVPHTDRGYVCNIHADYGIGVDFPL